MAWLQNQSNLAVIPNLVQRAARAQVSNFLFIDTLVEANPAFVSAMFWMLQLGQPQFKEPTVNPQLGVFISLQ